MKLNHSRTSVGRKNSMRDLGMMVKREIQKIKVPIEEQFSVVMPKVTEESSDISPKPSFNDQFLNETQLEIVSAGNKRRQYFAQITRG